jgi:V8-like Glu-specific endopeptidase
MLALGGCVSYGEPAAGFSNAAVGAAYVPLAATDLLTERYGAAVVIAPGIAVTNAHNANLVDPKSVIASLSDYDLLYFRTSQSAAVATAAPYDGERVIAYGQGAGNELRMARGVVKHFWPAAFGYLSDAGPGFSGGPVVDASTGALVGITYGFFDDEDPAGRLMVAYDSAFVLKELANSKIAAKPN